jgi:hypothetical protein
MIEKMKWAVLTLASASLVLLAAGSGWRAVARTGQEATEPRRPAQAKPEEPKRTEFTKPLAQPPDPAAQADDAAEAKANALESHRVEAELLEIETEALRSSIQQNIGSIQQYETMNFGGMPETNVRANEKYRDELERKSKALRETYAAKRLELARLKRLIARESRALNQPVTEKPDLTEMSRRLHALETKVDQILESMSKRPR